MLWLFTTLLTIAAVAIPIIVITRIALRVSEVAKKLRDPARLQQAFAETTAALRRAGADPRALEKLRGAALRKPEAPSPIPAPARLLRPATEPLDFVVAKPLPSARAPRRSLQRTPRPRRRSAPMPVAPLGGLDASDRFRLSEPPDIGEAPGPLGFSANWLLVAAFAGGAVYFLIR
jgi:hypothetical protein